MSKGKHPSGRGNYGKSGGRDDGRKARPGAPRGRFPDRKDGPKHGPGDARPARDGKPLRGKPPGARFEKPERPGRFDKPSRPFRPERPARPERAERPERVHAPRPPRDSHASEGSGKFEAGGNRVWLYGIHPVLAALANPSRKILRVAIASEIEATVGPRIATLADGHPAGLPDPEILNREQIDRLLPRAAVHQGLAALVEGLEDPDLEDIVRATDGHDTARVVVLDQVTDPHNIGAILRSCAGFGVAAVILPERHSPAATAVMAKAASGALERVPFVRVVNLARALDRLKAAGFWCVGLAGEAQTPINEADLTGKIALTVGAEGEGLRRLTRERCDLLVRIPMEKGVESLNVSNAAAIALYELARRTAS